MILWNTHHMQANKNAFCPQGIPDDLYALPEMSGEDYTTCTIMCVIQSLY